MVPKCVNLETNTYNIAVFDATLLFNRIFPVALAYLEYPPAD